jgi:hypothetical protein
VPLAYHIAIVALTRDISTRSLLQVTAAMQKQVSRDFAPIWGLSATVDAFTDLHAVPNDYFRVALFGDVGELTDEISAALGEESAQRVLAAFDGQQATGMHLDAVTRQPFALVAATDAWTITLSHEVLEMLADPWGNHLIAAAHPTRPRERVRYLIEICDPCLSSWYPVNGVPMADFYTPHYFDPVQAQSIRYSFTGSLTFPKEILPGGYLTFVDPRDSTLYQVYADGEPVVLASLSEYAHTAAPLRTLVDQNPRTPRVTRDVLCPAPSAVGADAPLVGVNEAASGAARSTAEAIYTIVSGSG